MAATETTTRRPGRRRSLGTLLRYPLYYAALILLTGVFVAPLLLMLSTSFKTNVEATQLPVTWIPRDFSLDAYYRLLNPASQTPVFRWFLNSMIAASAHTALVLAVVTPTAYALARMRFFGRGMMFAVIVSTLFIPHIIFLTPTYLVVDFFGWLDTLLAVIVPGAAGAFGVFFLRQFFVSLPRELEEAAVLDGANRLQIFLRIVLPLSKAPLVTLAVLSFLTNWNDFLWPVYVLFNAENQTLPPGLSTLQNSYSTDYAVLMAGGVVASAPILVIYVLSQRYIVEGVSRSGIKG